VKPILKQLSRFILVLLLFFVVNFIVNAVIILRNPSLVRACFLSPVAGAALKHGLTNLVCTFPASFFQSGIYYLSFFLVQDKRGAIFTEKDIISF